jgi:ABC-type sugar transport system ATPase subunit
MAQLLMPDPDMPSLTTHKLSKSYGGTHALKGASLEIRAGEIHALCGENGAGKSTLIKILSGVEQPDQGQVQWNKNDLPLGNVHGMESHGIVAVHQEPVVFPHLNVVDNLFAGRELSSGFGTWLNTAAMKKQTQDILKSLGEDLPLNKPVGQMPLAQRQMVSIARALFNQCRILILDEPTASLTARESEALFQIILKLRDEGVGILYVSHRLEEIFQLADRISVLRDGSLIATQSSKELSQDALIQQMVGRNVETSNNHRPTTQYVAEDKPVLELKAFSRAPAYQDINLKIHAGEILGMSGLVGAGRSEIAQAIFGIDAFDSGEIIFNGKKLENHNIRKAIKLGIAMVPEDRQHQGLALPLKVETNLLLPSLKDFQGMTGLDQVIDAIQIRGS